MIQQSQHLHLIADMPLTMFILNLLFDNFKIITFLPGIWFSETPLGAKLIEGSCYG